MATTPRVLITGSLGQIGTELILAMRERYGADRVVATDLRPDAPAWVTAGGPYEVLDVRDRAALEALVDRYRIDTVYHLAAILSATGEEKPDLAWDVNMNGLTTVLNVARDRQLARVFCPSSIAAFGPETPRDLTPQETVLKPRTVYGVTKVAGELLCDYYVRKFGLDVRGLRYPGIISSETPPGGGTTDFAVAIYYEAVKHNAYKCFVREDTVLPMMYMPDCIKATLDLMEADFQRLKHHCDFNLAAMSFSAGELAAEIAKHRKGFTCTYEPDFRQAIADSWPRSIDDSAAREEWGWKPLYDLPTMTRDMLDKLSARHAKGQL